MTTVRVITLGCSKNKVDTEHLLAQLPSDAFLIQDEGCADYSDYVLVNTCGFIGDAKEESIQTVLELAARKADGMIGKLAVFGCLSQRYAAELPGLIPEVDAWFGARDLRPVCKFLCASWRDNCLRRLDCGNRAYAYLKISEGCDRRCSYCAIPFIRGAHKSVPIEELVAEASLLAAKGIKELILIAQDTTFYGLDIYGRRALAELLDRLSEVQGIEWIRIHYSYPADFPEDVLDRMATNPKICKYMDIPLQHISDKVLENMHRHIDGSRTRELIAKIRSKVPSAALRTTMIVGHPGEGEDEFGELLQFIHEARFERLGAFKYSEEEGTWGAENLRDEVPEEVKAHRMDVLMGEQSAISLECNRSRIGSVEKVIVDDHIDGMLVCRSQYESPEVDGEILVKMNDEGRASALVGTFIRVRIVEAEVYDLIAELLPE